MVPVGCQVNSKAVEDWNHVLSFSRHAHCKGEREREGGGREGEGKRGRGKERGRGKGGINKSVISHHLWLYMCVLTRGRV